MWRAVLMENGKPREEAGVASVMQGAKDIASGGR
jgi:hypothetical protein